MGGVWHGPKGIEVEVIVLDKRPLIRVTRVIPEHGRMHLGFCATPREVAALVDLASLVEVIQLPELPRRRR
ncbi:hypothetical protein Aph01nite_43990 [Acrocarpospora phusangensis]|uniref:Transposase n=1 Tax=Acrocarpospora phusangensis TaxID=1070424 RepID=A0A919ULK8_9ACTN|nr:hypothetical protein [Acrocarpospora phusangensis]GIH26089.1 hypothetical protein Aph01nite_43990 [Acrocarpospora phusangensis]